jgi:rhodanese-related sulfurtransferase
MSLPTVTPTEAKRLLDEGAMLVDVRGPDEHARERIPGATNHPLDRLTTLDEQGRIAIFHCRSGQRTAVHAARLAAATTCDAYIVEGGIEAWKKAGLPIASDRNQPIEIQRQVQIAAGSLVLLGVVLGLIASPAFYAVAAFVGAGLTFAGISGWCGMAKLLAPMPWNRTATAKATTQVE